MEKITDKKSELGFLPDTSKNRYWQIKLGKVKWFRISKYRIVGVVFNFIKQILGIILFSILLIPISISASLISFTAKKEAEKEEKYDKKIEIALKMYRELMNIYPVRVYSPVIKSLEIGLINNHNFKPPILEIAIGDGYLSSLIFRGRNDKLTIGSDLIYETILSAKKYNHIDRLTVFDAEQIPLPDNCLNTVIMLNLMHHLPSRKKVLTEIKRVLKPGGQFIFTDNLYGWLEYTFDSRLLRFLRLGFIARELEGFKMHLFAQKLLMSSQYWDEMSENSEMEVSVNRKFVSKKTMTISSIFEYLNLLQGQPTRESMKALLRIGFLKRFINRKFENIIRYLVINENKLLKDNDGAFLFVVLRKKDSKDSNIKVNDLKYVCPKCGGDLILKDDKFLCKKCDENYPIRNNIPILLSYQKELVNLDGYLKISDKKKTREYIT